MRGSVGTVVALLLVASVAVGVDPTATASGQPGQDDATIELAQELHLTPDRPGEIEVTQSFRVPDSVTSLRTRIPTGASPVSTTGFRRESAEEFVWTGEAATPTLRYRYRPNETIDARGPIAGQGEYLFVDAGEWALVRRPRTSVHWGWRGSQTVTLDRSLRIAGPGATGEEMAFLGEHTTESHTAAGQTFRLVVPRSAELGSSATEIFDALSHASRELRVGERDEEVFMIAAPTTQVGWGVRGIQTGGADLWVRDAERVGNVEDVWVHEYVHTRQDYTTTAATEWITEAAATYYAALLALERGAIGYDDFRNRLSTGARPPQGSVVLARPDTWLNDAQYHKGALVIGALDRRLRLDTDRGQSFQRIFSGMNARADAVTLEWFLGAFADAGGQSIREASERYTTTRAVPDTWSEGEHATAFEPDPARIAYALETASFRVAGPYRNGSLADLTVVPGERLSVVASVTNRGGTAGPYEAVFRVDGEVVQRATGELEPGGSTSVEFAHAFESTGSHSLSVGTATTTVRVVEPADARVTDLSADRRSVDPGATVRVTATVLNPASIPGRATVAFRLDGTVVANRTVHVDADSSRTVTVPVTLDAAGTHRVTVANGTVTIAVGQAARADGEGDPNRDGASTPADGGPLDGFGVAVALLAIGIALLARRRR